MCRLSGSVGSLATNTVGQGDTREVALDRLTSAGWTIQRAVKSEPWPNEASLEIAKVWLVNGAWRGHRWLNGQSASASITTRLDRATRVAGRPFQLQKNSSQLFYASLVNGIGFVLGQDEADRLLSDDPRNADVLSPYIGGEDLNSSPTHVGSRWIVDFHEWSLDEAARYPACLEIVRARVKPARDLLPESTKRRVRANWWRYEHSAADMYKAIRGLDKVIAITSVSKLALPALVSARPVFAHTVYVFRNNTCGHFGLLSSAFHWWWTLNYASRPWRLESATRRRKCLRRSRESKRSPGRNGRRSMPPAGCSTSSGPS
ncbi:MAG: type IIL restriction-modification enzyme MmeI [Acidimicrobiales bacterium]